MMPVEVLRSDRTGRRGLFRSDWLMPFGQRTYGQSLYFLLKKKYTKWQDAFALFCWTISQSFPMYHYIPK
jgi:hypothetical protein